MTAGELAWLARRVPHSVLREVVQNADEATEYFSELCCPKPVIRTARLAAVELWLVVFGATRYLAQVREINMRHKPDRK